jgi:RNA polymerase sigma factor (sigma-70 family)
MPVARFPEGREPVTPDATDEIARRAGLLQALLALPLRQRATVILRYLEGMSERETAAVLGCSEGTVKSQSARALGTLRTFLERTESAL